jgi:hypothetical protein
MHLKNKKLSFIIIILLNTFLILILTNLILFFFNNKLIKQENIKRNFLSKMPTSYQVYYPKTNDRKFKNYIAIMGDSHAIGGGDGYLDLKIEDYSIAHVLKNLNPDNNYITFAWPGGGSISILKLFKMSRDNWFLGRVNEDPKKIIYLFSEENDFADDYNDKFLNRRQYAFTSKEYIKQIMPIFYYAYLNFYNQDTKYSTSINNIILFQNKEINTGGKGRISVPEVFNKELEETYNIIQQNLNELKKRTNQLYFVYIPSVATTYKMKNPIEAIAFKDGSKIEITNENMEKYHKYAVKKLKKICKKLNIKFIDLTDDLQKEAKKTLIHGPNDYGHFNIKGHQLIGKILNSRLN